MALVVVPFAEEHVEAAAALLAARHSSVRRHQPQLPPRYEDPAEALVLVRRFLAGAQIGPGVAAVRDGQLAGYLLSLVDPPGAWTGMQPFATRATDDPRVLEALYTAVAREWQARGCFQHRVKVFAGEQATMDAWAAMGFGLSQVQVVRDTSPVSDGGAAPPVRRAQPEDAALILDLQLELGRALEASPVFQPPWRTSTELGEETEAMLRDPARPAWLGYRGTEAMAFLSLRPAPGWGLSPLLQAEHMAVVDAMFDRDLEGQAEMASALLAEALDWARAAGYEYCYAVFMSSDRPAARFWEAMGFSPAAYWLARCVDPSCSLG